MREGGARATTYADAGVDRAEGARAEEGILRLAEKTLTDGVVRNPGGFGGLFRVPTEFGDGVLVSSADGVGTKLKIAMMADRHDTVGHDLVNHCVNDILVEGAHPLFFLDYIGVGRLQAGVVEQLVAGMVEGCRENGCALLGGETAEMPDFYAPGEYDIAGFIVGLSTEHDRPGSHRVKPGDALIGLASNGFHTNGYTLLRRVLFEQMELAASDTYPGARHSVADELLRVHKSYLKSVLPMIRDNSVNALAHITGGGIADNLERVIPNGLQARIDTSVWELPNTFAAVMQHGPVERDEMFATFNMGIGMVLVVDEAKRADVIARARSAGETTFELGRIVSGTPRVVLT